MPDDAGESPYDAAGSESAQRLLRRHGLRVTRPRTMVLQVLVAAGDHLEAADVVRHVRTGLGTVSVQAVYDVLAALSQHGLLRRIEPPGKPALYEARVGDNHHHLICRHCGAIANIACAADSVPCLQPSHDHDYHIDEAEITWLGVCADCREAATATATE